MYFKPDSQNEICNSANTTENTFRIAKMVNIYGPGMFGGAIVEPSNTLRKDILPRFFSISLVFAPDGRSTENLDFSTHRRN